MTTELNKALSKDGLSATVTATATDALASGLRLLQQGGYGDDTGSGAYGGGISCVVVYVIVIPIPAGRTASSVESVGAATALATAKNPSVLMILLTVSGQLALRMCCRG
jgi:hypothetical protein